jgi:hypothetical protein
MPPEKGALAYCDPTLRKVKRPCWWMRRLLRRRSEAKRAAARGWATTRARERCAATWAASTRCAAAAPPRAPRARRAHVAAVYDTTARMATRFGSHQRRCTDSASVYASATSHRLSRQRPVYTRPPQSPSVRASQPCRPATYAAPCPAHGGGRHVLGD